jgi:hypothetical protein
MTLAGYPKTYDHPKVTRLVGDGTLDGGSYMLIKAMGNVPNDWIEYRVRYPNSVDPTQAYLIRVVVGGTLQGPFSYIKHNDEGDNSEEGGAGTAQDAYTLVYEVED